ncbi:MAG: copper oxidase [Proteobacteria bacterium]|nr:MAG: copper oxidase [Pseudomonadota bacterium]
MILTRPLTRRTLLVAAAGALTLPAVLRAAAQPGAAPLTLRARPGSAKLRAEGPATPVAVLEAGGEAPVRLPRGGGVDATFINDLPVAARLRWRGLDGAPDLAALANGPVAPGGRAAFTLPLAFAGTLFCTVEPVAELPPATLAVVVEELAAGAYDREATLVIEEWRLGADGRAVLPGQAPGDATAVFTVNRMPAADLTARAHERLRIRFINGSQRTVFAVRIPDQTVYVWAIASRPAEPFVARNSQLVLPPGGRVDALVDVATAPGAETPILLHDGTRLHTIGRLTGAEGGPVRPEPLPPPAPLPAEGLPATLDLARAARVTLDLGAERPANAPAFALRRGQVAVLALKNDGPQPAVVQIAGHHVRLLDRLDDGWKPFWLDTVLVPPRVTERVAFLAEHAGRFPIEVRQPAWDAAGRTSWYVVE